MNDDEPSPFRDCLHGAAILAAVVLACAVGLAGRILLYEVAPWLHGALP